MKRCGGAKRIARTAWVLLSVLASAGLCEAGSEKYVLITGDSLKGSFQLLVDRRISQGMDGSLVTVEQIESDPAYSGLDIQEKIREYIKSRYDPSCPMYVVLGGDEHIVPVRYCRTEDDGDIVPVDLYYADSDGTRWDADGDGIYGEIGDVGLAELTPEVCLGRVPVDTPDEVQAYLSKIIRYETVDPNEFVDSMLLLSGAGYEFCYEGPARPPAYRDHEPVSQKEIEMTDIFWSIIQPYWQPGHLARLFDSNTDWDVSQFGDHPITWQNVLGALDNGYHYVYYWQHSGSNYWTFRDEDTGCVFNWYHGSLLTNAFPSIIFARGCSTARYDDDDTDLCESLIRNGNGGAVVYFGHTRSAGGSPHWDQILRNMFQESHHRIGEAYRSCLTVLAQQKISDPWHQYIFVLLGDPALACHHQHKKTLELLSPKGNEIIKVGSDLFIRWNAAGDFRPEDKVALCYSDDDGTHWYSIPAADSLPYNAAAFNWEHCPLPCGSGYRVKVSSVSDLLLQSESTRSFRIAEMVDLTIQSQAVYSIKITGAHCYQTDFTLSVVAGEPVQLAAPESWDDLVFMGWTTPDGAMIGRDCLLDRSFDADTVLIAPYEYHGDFFGFYVNDDIPENGMPAGDDSQDGRSPETPMRSIQALLDRYPDIGYGDVIHVSAGRYIENLFLSHTHVGLTIRGAGPDKSVIDGGHVGSCLLADNGWFGELEHLCFENGMGMNHGGALQLGGGAAGIVRDCWFVNNEAFGRGGAIYLSDSVWPAGLEVYDSVFTNNQGNKGIIFITRNIPAVFHNCTFQGNSTNVAGVFEVVGSNVVEIEECSFEGNSTTEGGAAIEIRGQGVITAKHCRFIANSANQGGAVEVGEEASFIADNCVFQGNAAPNGGGAVHIIESGAAQLRRCAFKDNTGYQGGGAYCRDQSTVEMDHCLVTGNTVSQAGGAVGIYHSAVLTANNCTIADNSSSNLSGGIAWHSWGDLTLTNCILFGNTSRLYPDLRLSGNGTATVSFCCTPVLRDGVGDITDDPLFVDPYAGDYHLKSQAGRWDPNIGSWLADDTTSPCIDAGDPASAWCGEMWPHGGRINMGACGGTMEASLSVSNYGIAGDMDCDGTEWLADFGLLAEQWGHGGEGWSVESGGSGPPWRADLDRDGSVGLGDLVMLAEGWKGEK
jgi:hypothetical protein